MQKCVLSSNLVQKNVFDPCERLKWLNKSILQTISKLHFLVNIIFILKVLHLTSCMKGCVCVRKSERVKEKGSYRGCQEFVQA